MSRLPAHALRTYMRTASTRRWSSAVGSRPSLAKKAALVSAAAQPALWPSSGHGGNQGPRGECDARGAATGPRRPTGLRRWRTSAYDQHGVERGDADASRDLRGRPAGSACSARRREQRDDGDERQADQDAPGTGRAQAQARSVISAAQQRRPPARWSSLRAAPGRVHAELGRSPAARQLATALGGQIGGQSCRR